MDFDADLPSLKTERWNPGIPDLATVDTLHVLELMNQEDATVAAAVAKVLPEVARAVDHVVLALREGGRLFYVGAGTSGRLAVLDAAECPPTFDTPPEMVQAIIAGGADAIFQAQEGVEDREDLGARDAANAGVGPGDIVVGITASGRTPYVLGALRWAQAQGIRTVSVSCNPRPLVAEVADINIAVDTGPEVLMGSTRLKAGTAQKMVLNMLSTAAMIRLGKTYQNLMVDMKPMNRKLRDRAVRIVMLAARVSRGEAERLLLDADWESKTAIAMHLLAVDAATARKQLASVDGVLARLLPPVDNMGR
ncbi:glucokinase regulatory-like protein [Sulfobacillus acidophilus TPY]|uniref:N-acetylmuramic acid 6-phosphate etherase n=1 Tax=Sulfobacillus acidophilus (strain ATCC 700253 / DSM 10332 / NAL) TaxID=679936 RepID=G8TU71_SULAD|nr:glucokinase regulatory-like protein [Sulfobacillus acidophilus TPY]AEW05743.1 N-acetylmuramic acid 6-phosphate etherase [Sulfobacillus acidophilus DSM 10332]